MESKTTKSLATSFKSELSKHGFSFQAAVYNEAQRLFREGKSIWEPEAPEFPVDIQGRAAHIDFLLRSETNKLLVVECKRVNPAFGSWCFARSRTAIHQWSQSVVWGERMTFSKHLPLHGVGARLQFKAGEHYSTGLELRTKAKGDAAPLEYQSTTAISDAVTQACRGMNGLVNYYGNRREFMEMESTTFLLPVVVTTANLFTTDLDLESASLDTGLVEAELSLNETPWLYYQSLQSPQIQHDYSPGLHPDMEVRRRLGSPGSPYSSTELQSGGQSAYLRSVAIVSGKGLSEFLSD